MNRYQALPRLEAFVLARGCETPHVPTSDAPGTPAELHAWASANHFHNPSVSTPPLPVYDGGSENTIYSSDAVNFAFRAWHDTLHLQAGHANLGGRFRLADELFIASQHVKIAHAAGHRGSSLDALWYDTAGQAWHWEIHKAYVDDQAGFVQACFNGGIFAACSYSWE